MLENLGIQDEAFVSVKKNSGQLSSVKLSGFYTVECFDKSGQLKWSEKIENLVTNVGKDHALDVALVGGTQIATWYCGLTSATPTPAAGDTMASHAGWTENENYSEAVRQTVSFAAVSGQSTTNSASPASFSIDTDSQSIGGLFVVSDSTKGGTTGTLYSVGAFSGGNKSADNGDTLNVTYTASIS